MYNLSELTDSFKSDEKGYYVVTSTSIKYAQQEDARKQGYSIKDNGTTLTASGKFYIDNLPTEIDLLKLVTFLQQKGLADPEREIIKSYFKEFALELHGKNRSNMTAALDKKIPKECEVIHGFLAMVGIDITSLTFEQKCDKDYLASLIK